MWSDRKYSEAYAFLSESVPGMSRDQQTAVLEGRSKLTGRNDLDLVPDNSPSAVSLEQALLISAEASTTHDMKSDEDRAAGRRIMSEFETYYEEFGGYTQHRYTCERLIAEWKGLLKSVRDELSPEIPYWMSVWLREVDGIRPTPIRTFAGLSNKTVAYSVFPDTAWSDREEYEKLCSANHIYGEDVNAIWNDHQRMVVAFDAPVAEKALAAIAEDDDKAVERSRDRDMKSQYGWLSRDGVYYSCGYAEHRAFSETLVRHMGFENPEDNAEHVLELMGWLKICTRDYCVGEVFFEHYIRPSYEQRRAVREYCEQHNMRTPADCED